MKPVKNVSNCHFQLGRDSC